jgi:alkaline phosphatase
VKKDVLADIKAAMDTVKTEKPRFYFIEKLLPHHIHFSASKEEERETYLEKIVQVNDWLKETVSYIEENDSDAIIIILADHGGWVDIGSYDEMFTTTDANQLHSIFSTLAAIRWNGNLTEEMDSELRSNVNLFRILFANLSEDASYLKYLEDNSSYNLKSGSFRNSVQAVLDDTGNAIAK